MPTTEEIAWAAGLFEGEGSFKFRAGQHSVGMMLGMSDEDCVRSFHRVVGVGAVRVRNRNAPSWKKHWKTQHIWEAQALADVKPLIEKFLPWLHSRRGEQARKALSILSTNYGRRETRTHCKRGHPLAGDNLYINPASGYRQCRTCHRNRERLKYQQRKAHA